MMPAVVDVQFADGIDMRRAASGVGGRRAVVALMRQAAMAALRHVGVVDARISVTLLDDAGIAGLHSRYLKSDDATDVLSFALHEPGEPPLGDVYVGLDEARRQAGALRVPLREELARLAIHGTLHVLGLHHPDGSGRERSRMWRLQERILREVTGP